MPNTFLPPGLSPEAWLQEKRQRAEDARNTLIDPRIGMSMEDYEGPDTFVPEKTPKEPMPDTWCELAPWYIKKNLAPFIRVWMVWVPMIHLVLWTTCQLILGLTSDAKTKRLLATIPQNAATRPLIEFMKSTLNGWRFSMAMLVIEVVCSGISMYIGVSSFTKTVRSYLWTNPDPEDPKDAPGSPELYASPDPDWKIVVCGKDGKMATVTLETLLHIMAAQGRRTPEDMV
ncbi:hypothetical protein ABW21_db0201318 [Orbilia brochopaga]|nr:hypothetical protein ABW21_db0201318 [Drechslerella brochopaga]